MDSLLNDLISLFTYIFIHPKSTMSLVFFLAIIVIIAFFVNRKRDASGQVSFIDKSRTGVICVRIYRIVDGRRADSLLLPLWMPEGRLITIVKILMTPGEYELKACWRGEKKAPDEKNMFQPRPIEQEKTYGLSKVGRIEIDKRAVFSFHLAVSGKKLLVVSPDSAAFQISSDKKPFPLVISDPQLTMIHRRFERLRKTMWIFTLIDDRIFQFYQNEVKAMRRKWEAETIQSKKLKLNIDELMRQIGSGEEETVETKEESEDAAEIETEENDEGGEKDFDSTTEDFLS